MVAIASSSYIPHQTESTLYQVDVMSDIQKSIEDYSNAIDLVLPKYAMFPVESKRDEFQQDIALINNKYLTEDFTFYAPVDGYFVTSRDAMTRWYTEMRELYKLRYQSRVYGSYNYKIVRRWPFTIEVNTTQIVNGMAENPALSPVSFMQQDKYISSQLSTHLTFQFTQVGLTWKMNWKNEDFSYYRRDCVHTCGSFAPFCSATGPCSQILGNWNTVLNPNYPPPAGYIGIRNPPVVYN